MQSYAPYFSPIAGVAISNIYSMDNITFCDVTIGIYKYTFSQNADYSWKPLRTTILKH